MPRKLVVEIVGDSKSYERALGRSAKATNQFGTAMAATSPRVGKLQGVMGATGFSALGMAGAVGGLSVVLGSKAVGAASDLNEEISKSAQVFGDSAVEIKAWSETTASAMGISQTEALRATGTFGALFKTLDVGNKENSKLSKSLVQLASDMASFNNANPEEVLLALRSGLTGEAEPLRRFGVFLSEARTQQVAFTQTGKQSAKQLTNQEKVLARYSVIMKDTVSAQGDFERTSGSLANSQRALSAETENLSASIGAFLIPAMTGAVQVLTEFIRGVNEAVGAMTALHDFFEDTKAFDGWNKGVEDAGDNVSDFFGRIRDGIPLLDEIIEKGREAREAVRGAFDATPGDEFQQPTVVGPRGRAAPGALATEATANAKAAAEAIRKATARANADLDQQIRDSASRIAHLKDLVREDPANAKLQQRLTAEIKKQNGLIDQQVALNKSNKAAAASAAKAAHDAAVQAHEDAVQAKKDAEELRQKRVKSQQFQELGLTPEGLRPTPSSGALLRRAQGLEDQLKGTVFDKGKTGKELREIVAWLKKHLLGAKKDVRDAILDMLNGISDALDGKDAKKGPLTKTTSLNTRKLAEGLGLTPEQERELRQRASKFNSAGRALSGNRTTAPGGSGAVRDRGVPFVVESHTTINIDGKRVANVVTRNQQKDKRRNPRQKRGQNRGD